MDAGIVRRFVGDGLARPAFGKRWRLKMVGFILWCILFCMCWPLALLALALYPFIWLILLPFRIVGIAVDGVLSLVKSIFFLPVRLLRGPRTV